jgi:hypothetical protein
MRALELESSQKLWRWVVVAALGVLILETWLAGRLARAATARKESRKNRFPESAPRFASDSVAND